MARNTRRTTQAKSAKRREVVGRRNPRPTLSVAALLARPEYLYGIASLVVLVLVGGFIVNLSRERIIEQLGEVMPTTRLHRLDFQVPDESATDKRREEARKSAPQVYKLNTLYLERISASLNGLPKAVTGKTDINEVSEELRTQFSLTNTDLEALQRYAVDGETTQRWKDRVSRLVNEILPAYPLLASDVYQNYWAAREYSASLERIIQRADGTRLSISGDAAELRAEIDERTRRHLRDTAIDAGFTTNTWPVIVARLLYEPQPTLLFDQEATAQLAEQAAAAVETQYTQHERGGIVYRRGDVLNTQQYQNLLNETAEFDAQASVWQRWTPRVGVCGLLLIISVLLGAYIALFHPRIVLNPLRVAAICGVMVLMLTLAVLISPKLPYVAAIAPTLFVSVVVLLAYEQRLAFFISALQATMVTFALDAGLGLLLLQLVGSGTFIALLRDVRHRNTLIHAAGITSIAVCFGTLLHGAVELPVTSEAVRQVGEGAVWAMVSALGVGFVVLGILPTVEQIFDITTGMTLAELRDPKQPLLRQLQQKAPGTYNHSLQVANIAEAAAEAIGANGLLVYVGAMYHDIGKLNKPEYFVENQASGNNKHEKLSPAMSLLVIIGHVKDGVELAKEYRLPRTIIQFIETHHGTTLVEYFYHAAKSAAEDGDKSAVDEVSFRYPGPKPRTKEAAILMLSDAVESATRAMAEPSPGKIEQLVRALSKKRLEDGQFSQCDLTFGELHRIEEAIISRMCAIHHSRIAYPSTDKSAARESKASSTSADRPKAASA